MFSINIRGHYKCFGNTEDTCPVGRVAQKRAEDKKPGKFTVDERGGLEGTVRMGDKIMRWLRSILCRRLNG